MSKIEFRDDGRTVWIELSDPPLNILDIAMLEELRDALCKVPASRTCVVITAAGTRAFSAGASVHDHAAERVAQMLALFHDCIRTIIRLPQITVAVVNGPALGGGCELAMACDFVLASDRAEFGQPEIGLGVFPPVAVLQLPRLAGGRLGLEMILSGDALSAAAARGAGLVNEVFPHDELQERSRGWMERFLRHSGSSVRYAKRAWRIATADEFDARLAAIEELYLRELMQTADANEGIAAFMEKRRAGWKS